MLNKLAFISLMCSRPTCVHILSLIFFSVGLNWGVPSPPGPLPTYAHAGRRAADTAQNVDPLMPAVTFLIKPIDSTGTVSRYSLPQRTRNNCAACLPVCRVVTTC